MNIDERLKEYAALVGELQRQLNEKNEKIRRLTEMVDSAKEPEVYELGQNKLVIFNGGTASVLTYDGDSLTSKNLEPVKPGELVHLFYVEGSE